jgi:hypothetical protein
MGRRTRLTLIALVVLAAGVFVATAAALRFTDDSYFMPTGTVDQSYSKTFAGDGGCGPALPYQYRVLNGALPPGLSLSSSGTISGKPTNSGSYSFWVELSDQNPPTQAWCLPATAQREFTINVDPRVLITNQVPPTGTVGSPYSLTLVAVMKSGPDATAPPSSPLTWTIQSGQLPAGLTMTSGGVISGTPTTAGDSTFTLQAALADGRSDTKTQTITVRDALKTTSTGIVGARSEVTVPFDATLTATGGTGTFTWTLAGGSLPPGVTLAPTGAISGTPHAAGRFAFTAAVTDTESRTMNVNGVIAVAPKLTITTMSLHPGKANRLYRARLLAVGGVLPKLWNVTTGPLPRGVHLDRATGILSGLPRKPGVYRVTVRVTDGFKVVSSHYYRLVILP